MSGFVLHPCFEMTFNHEYLQQGNSAQVRLNSQDEYRWVYQSSFYKQHIKHVTEVWKFLISNLLSPLP